MIKDKVKDDIRNSYFGGNVSVFANKINKEFLYDINSQYPKAMLEDIPLWLTDFESYLYLTNIFTEEMYIQRGVSIKVETYFLKLLLN